MVQNSKTILIADEENWIEMYRDVLEAEGFSVISTGSVEQAFVFLEKCDLAGMVTGGFGLEHQNAMPDDIMKGINIAQACKEKGIPVVMCANPYIPHLIANEEVVDELFTDRVAYLDKADFVRDSTMLAEKINQVTQRPVKIAQQPARLDI